MTIIMRVALASLISRKACVATLVVCIIIGCFAVIRYVNTGSMQNCDHMFSLLNARRRCEKDEPPKKQEYDILVNALGWRIDEWKRNDSITHVTVYFRDLENGPIFGINEKEKFAPASLLKVPIMIALLKYAETHPEILDEELNIGDTIPPGQNVFDADKTLLPNQAYPVHEIMRRMIVYSDNTSKELLRHHLEELSPGILDQTFIDLGISLQNPDGSQFLTIKSYASLFRALFNASYLNRERSQQALKVLSDVEFSSGIVQGVPAGTVVAHKFGYLDAGPDERQLHDCGIVYHPKTPYLLCIMTRGKKPEIIEKVIGKISNMVYDEVTVRDLD